MRSRRVAVELRTLELALFPEGGVFNAQCLWIELRILAGLLLRVVVLQCLHGWLLDNQDADDVEPRSGTDTNIAQYPGGTSRRGGANDNGDKNQHAQTPNDAATYLRIFNPAVEVRQVYFGHVVVRQNGGKGEEQNSQCHKARTKAWELGIHTFLDKARSDSDIRW